MNAEPAPAIAHDRAAGFPHLRSAARLLLLVAHFLRGFIELAIFLPRVPPGEQRPRVKAWCDKLLRIAGVSLAVQGRVETGRPLLLVANHVSWLDVVVLQALHPCRFVAKSEIRRWPVIGAMSTLCGTLYVDRSARRATVDAAAEVAQALRQGDCVVLFPEGTTSDGSALLPFRASLLQGAIDARVRVLPVALRFVDTRTQSVSRAAAYAGGDSLLGAMWRALGRDVTAQVSFGDALHCAGRHRRALAVELHSHVAGLQGRQILESATPNGG